MFRIGFRLLAAFCVIVLLIAGAVAIYNTGFNQGASITGKIIVPNSAQAVNPAPYTYYPAYRPWGFGWFPFGCLIPLFGFLVLFMIVRRVMWGGYGSHRWYRRHHGWRNDDPDQVPPQVAEWHRKMHEPKSDQADL